MNRKIFAVAAFSFILGLSTMAQSSAPAIPAKPVEAIKVNEEKHDFGKIPQGTPVYTTFEIKGVSEPLKLEMVQAGCGCTVPEFKAGTYPAGEAVPIKVGFNAAAPGSFTKTITITYNDGQQKILYITGIVEQTPSQPAPGNGGIARIKL